jgi:hypothetical protein
MDDEEAIKYHAKKISEYTKVLSIRENILLIGMN